MKNGAKVLIEWDVLVMKLNRGGFEILVELLGVLLADFGWFWGYVFILIKNLRL